MKKLQTQSGQILIPALAAYLGLLLLFFGMVGFGMRTLMRMRMETAAQAAALSVARAQAQVLNRYATHNLLVNSFVPLTYHGMGAMPTSARDTFQTWLQLEQKGLSWKMLAASQAGYCASIGSTVARLNGADPGLWYGPPFQEFHLEAKPMMIALMAGYVPQAIEEFSDVYYAREWEPGRRKAQPNHIITWLAAKGRIIAVASARVYLDLQDEAALHNGGFPRLDEKWSLGDAGIQSFWPQFNARLRLPSPGFKAVLEQAYKITLI